MRRQRAQSHQVRSSAEIIKEGLVYKLAGYFHKTWEPRWFRIEKRRLVYYLNAADLSTPRRSLNLRGAHAFRVVQGKMPSRTPYCILLQIIEPVLKTYYFCVESEHERADWIEAIITASRYTMEEQCQLRSNDERIVCTAVSRNCDRMITGTEAGNVSLWDLQALKLIETWEAHCEPVKDLNFCGNGRFIFTLSEEGSIRLWNSSTRMNLEVLEDVEVTTCIKVPGSSQIVLGTVSGDICLWDVNTGEWGSKPLYSHSSPAEFFRISSDGSKLLSISRDGSVFCVNIKTKSVEGTLECCPSPIRADLSSTGHVFVVMGSNNTLTLYGWGEKIQVKGELLRHKAEVTSCRFNPMGDKVISTSEDGSLLVWETTAYGQLLFEISQHAAISSCAISPGDRLVLSVSGNEVSVWDSQSMKSIQVLKQLTQVTDAFFLSNGVGFIVQQENGTMGLWTL